MEQFRFDEGSLRPTYMSQAEANEVMELWAERQREEAARQSLITIHDVAEATQLSTQDVERLLQEVRSQRRGPSASVERVEIAAAVEPSFATAFWRMAPYIAVAALLLVPIVSGIVWGPDGGPNYTLVARFQCTAVVFGVVLLSAWMGRRIAKWVRSRWVVQARGQFPVTKSFRLLR